MVFKKDSSLNSIIEIVNGDFFILITVSFETAEILESNEIKNSTHKEVYKLVEDNGFERK